MPRIKYVGSAHVRVINKKHLGDVGVSDPTAIHVDTTTGGSNEVEVSQSTAEWLLKNEPDDWRAVDK